MFLLHYTCSVLRSRNSRKAFKFFSKCLVLLLYGNQYRNLCFVHKTTYLWSMSSPGGGELSLFACPGVGNRPPSENKIANPRGYARGGGMVTGRIEPCITSNDGDTLSRYYCCFQYFKMHSGCIPAGFFSQLCPVIKHGE